MLIFAVSFFQTPSFRKKDEQSPVGGPTPGSGGYGTLPKQRSKEDVREGKRSRGFHSLGKTLLRVRSGKRSSSAPNLGDTLEGGNAWPAVCIR